MEQIVKLTCDVCGKEFDKKLKNHKIAIIKGYKKKICSKECRDKNLEKRKIYKCTNCGKDTIKTPSLIKNSVNVFCSSNCAAIYNNKLYPKRVLEGICFDCKVPCNSCNKFCKKCMKKKDYIFSGEKRNPEKTLAHYASKSQDANRYGAVRDMARKITKNWIQECCNCGYSKHVETCHKKAICDFSSTTKIKEVNNINNLILLCKNCHWEADHGLLDMYKIPNKNLQKT